MAANVIERESDLDEVFARFAEHPLYPMETRETLSENRVRELGREVFAERRPALSSLIVAVRAGGLNLEEAAQRLDAPEGLLWKLHRRLIAFETIPQAFVERLAESVRRSVEEVGAYLRQPPVLAMGASYRADTAPEVVCESFEAALETDPDATDAMIARWQTS